MATPLFTIMTTAQSQWCGSARSFRFQRQARKLRRRFGAKDARRLRLARQPRARRKLGRNRGVLFQPASERVDEHAQSDVPQCKFCARLKQRPDPSPIQQALRRREMMISAILGMSARFLYLALAHGVNYDTTVGYMP